MKTKNLILGVFAFTLAIGSAFASLTSNPDIYIRQGAGATPCLDVTDECDGVNGVNCRVSVPEFGTKDAYLEGCEMRAQHTNNTILPAELVN